MKPRFEWVLLEIFFRQKNFGKKSSSNSCKILRMEMIAEVAEVADMADPLRKSASRPDPECAATAVRKNNGGDREIFLTTVGRM